MTTTKRSNDECTADDETLGPNRGDAFRLIIQWRTGKKHRSTEGTCKVERAPEVAQDKDGYDGGGKAEKNKASNKGAKTRKKRSSLNQGAST